MPAVKLTEAQLSRWNHLRRMAGEEPITDKRMAEKFLGRQTKEVRDEMLSRLGSTKFFEEYACGCVSEYVDDPKDMPGYCGKHGSDRRHVNTV